jgi:hypothetical protein
MAEAATGCLHVVRIGGDIDPVKAEYRIAFAPLDGRLRGRHARCEGLDALTDFRGRPVFRFRRSNGRGRLSRGAGFTQFRASP